MHSPKGVLLSAMVESFVFHKPGPENVVSQFKGAAGFAPGGAQGCFTQIFRSFRSRQWGLFHARPISNEPF